jgi:hypothetical protein
VQQLKGTEDKRCIEWELCTKHNRQKKRKCNGCMQEDSEVDRVVKPCRTVMRLVSCC